jgi:tRNA 2-thiouridine synthesizing protein A
MIEPDDSGASDDRGATDAANRVARHIDATGLACPMPVIELSRAIDEVELGDVVTLVATDPAAGVDVPVWCRMRRQKLHRREQIDGIWHFAVERRS